RGGLTTMGERGSIDALRSYGRRRKSEVDASLAPEQHADPAPDPSDRIEARDRAAALGRAIATLPAGQREAVEQLALCERTLADAAAATRRSTGALKVNPHRALRTPRAPLAGGGWPWLRPTRAHS